MRCHLDGRVRIEARIAEICLRARELRETAHVVAGDDPVRANPVAPATAILLPPTMQGGNRRCGAERRGDAP